MKGWSSVALWNSVALLTTSVIGILAFWDGWDEGEVLSGVIGSLLAMVAPGFCWAITLKAERRGKVFWGCRIGALVITLVGIAVYWGYASAGPSDPDTAGHMHVELVPVMYFGLALIVQIPLFFIDAFRTKRSKIPGSE